MVELCLLLKLQEQRRIFHAEHLGDEFGPEHLAFALLITTPFPAAGKCLSRFSLLLLGFHLQMILYLRKYSKPFANHPHQALHFSFAGEGIEQGVDYSDVVEWHIHQPKPVPCGRHHFINSAPQSHLSL